MLSGFPSGLFPSGYLTKTAYALPVSYEIAKIK
jgi:hypothetical protein